MTAFGTEVISEGIFAWKIKIISMGSYRQAPYPCIGIIKSNETNLKRYYYDASWDKVGYQFNYNGDNAIGCGRTWISTGDIIDINFDLDQRTLKFIINQDVVIAFDNIDKVSYRLALTSFCDQGPSSKFQLL